MARPGTATGIAHKQQLQEMLIDGRASRLNDIDIGTADAFLELNVQLAVGKTLEQRSATLHTEAFGNIFRKGNIGGT
jgi:hypothetical protein